MLTRRDYHPGSIAEGRRLAEQANDMGRFDDSKLYDVLIAFGVARRWPEVISNAVGPGGAATHPAAARPEVQDRLLDSCRALTGAGI